MKRTNAYITENRLMKKDKSKGNSQSQVIIIKNYQIYLLKCLLIRKLSYIYRISFGIFFNSLSLQVGFFPFFHLLIKRKTSKHAIFFRGRKKGQVADNFTLSLFDLFLHFSKQKLLMCIIQSIASIEKFATHLSFRVILA